MGFGPGSDQRLGDLLYVLCLGLWAGAWLGYLMLFGRIIKSVKMLGFAGLKGILMYNRRWKVL
jgi:hypothetical protein